MEHLEVKKERIVMYMHAGSGNHGCEAIVNSVCGMLEASVDLISYRKEEDERYSLGELCEIQQEQSFDHHPIAHVLYYLYRAMTGDQESFIRYRYGDVFKYGKYPLALSIGGDNYCYSSMLNDLALCNRAFQKACIPTILLGCSIEPELLQKQEIIEDLRKYHTIIARESITYEALLKTFEKGPKILQIPDPAFTLGTADITIPDGFWVGNTVGINVSPLVTQSETKPGITMENYKALISWILENTDMQVALIPHVVWKNNDDRTVLHELYEQFRETERVVEIPDGTCEEIKGYISQCRYFVGARTHATIAAYSSCVPTLVVGYSVKARGIARDLFGTDDNYVIPVQSLTRLDDLSRGFAWLVDQEEMIRERLLRIMPQYKEQAMETGKEVNRLWEEFSQLPGISFSAR